MTNAEKYLKDGVDVDKFVKEYLASRTGALNVWLNEPSKITLTEDERVILRNIDKKYTHISRTYGDIWFGVGEETEDSECTKVHVFNHLFQFIKERRRI